MRSRNLGACFCRETAGEKIALIEPGPPVRQTTYAELQTEADAVARGLVAHGLTRGDRVGLMAMNSREYLAAYFGVMRAGMVAVPFSYKLAPPVIEHICRDAELKLLFIDEGQEPKAPGFVETIRLDAPAFEDLKDPGPFAVVEPDPGEVGMILYTSGSTGVPKGVLLSHDSQRWSLERGSKAAGDRCDAIYIVAAPMFHMNATISTKGAFWNGATVVMLPAFDARAYAAAIPQFGVTTLTSVPTMLALVAREGDALGGLDFSSVRDVTMGSAPLTQALIDKVQALFPGAKISNSYGTTEGGPSPFGPHPDGVPRPALSLGYPHPGTGAELLEGSGPDEGVLYLKNPMQMNGYNNLPEKTVEVVRDGWYRTGDIMRRDENGFFYFIGRADDMFNVGGENVWPGEVEKLLETMPGVHQACVVPAPHETKGMAPFAFVVPSPRAELTEDAVKQFALSNAPAHAHPRHVEFLDAIPLAGTNKPDRNALTARAAELVRGAM
ncbi:AMP-binding protein [Rhodobacteraceae bacterium 2CG4]|uniref:AMP-binding protein n=2 Tax=Halovulum marinum TaxID=2662447 RepID=A0A6L5Z4A4_9RHOB|nr:AMP-binding protein [Halovulum marinum]